jgi:hypothetical protein
MVSKTVLASPSLNTYWVYAQEGIPVTYKYCVNIPAVGNQCSQVASTTFNVSGPGDAPITTDAYPSVNIVQLIVKPCLPGDLEPFMEYGNTTGYNQDDCASFGSETGPPGMKFTPPSTTSGGNYSFVQLVTKDKTTYRNKTKSLSCVSPPGLDGQFPYPTQNDGTTNDSPDAALGPIYTRVSRVFGASMYLMWTSSIPSSIAVPIGYQSWHFKTDTTNPSFPTSQSLTTPASEYVGKDGDFVVSATQAKSQTLPYGYPTWGNIATPVCPTSAANEEEQEGQ